MMNEPWKVVYTKQGLKDKRTAISAGFGDKVKELIGILKENPYKPYPPYEKLVGDLKGMLSRRINRQHRLVYAVYEAEHTVKVISMWEHYE
ncbi:Txe/YoeB family addiction module toxin [Cloacibacillus sp. An23]|uniref:Txe/YoeB family addiction module toxin n=1 Tax=Cloacibacillus sp. An23 TaxID=1965591 RepID=UPI0019514410|nr:Txe/YoeB family addiction module toxin [Cloacibacillus sp. An23]